MKSKIYINYVLETFNGFMASSFASCRCKIKRRVAWSGRSGNRCARPVPLLGSRERTPMFLVATEECFGCEIHWTESKNVQNTTYIHL